MSLLQLSTVLALAALAACIHGGRANEQNVTFLTYNLGLPSNTSAALAYKERRTAQLADITEANSPWRDADVVCLQEIWVQSDLAEWAATARTVGFPHSYTGQLESMTTGKKACEPTDAAGILGCASNPENARQCAGFTDNAAMFMRCVVTVCNSTLANLPQTCINCALQQEFTDLNGLIGTCIKADASEYPSTLGVMLLSKRRISGASLTPYTMATKFFRRGYIQADVEGVGKVYCAHHTPDVELFNDTQATADLGRVNTQEMTALVNEAKGKGAVLMGDFNTSPAKPDQNVTALYPQSYQQAVDAGFVSGYVGFSQSQCSFCGTTNILLLAQTTSTGIPFRNEILDHVFADSSRYTVAAARRVFDQIDVPITSLPGLPAVSPSDHYGVLVTYTTTVNSGSGSDSTQVAVLLVCVSMLVGLLLGV